MPLKIKLNQRLSWSICVSVHEVWQSLPHGRAEERLTKFFEERGYKCIDTAYHHLHSGNDYHALRCCDAPTCLAYRTKADFMVLRDGHGFTTELKVGQSPSKCYLEAYPVALHSLETSLGIECYYIYAGAITNNNMVVCPVEDIVPSKLVVPTKGLHLAPILTKAFPHIPVEYRETRSGTSGDPFLEVSAKEVSSWIDIDKYWQ